MPDPRPLGNVAKNTLAKLTEWDREDVEDAVSISFAAAEGDMKRVQELADRVARRNMDAFQAGVFLEADQPKRAEDTVIDAEIRSKKQSSA